MNSYTKESLDGLALIGRMVAREGKREELLQFLEEVTAAAAEIEGPAAPLAVVFSTSPANPDMVVLYEHYASRASFDEHLANHERISAYRAHLARASELLAQPTEIVEVATPVARWTRTGPALRQVPPSGHSDYSKEEVDGVVVVARVHATPGQGPELLAVLEEAVPPQAVYEADPALVMDFAISTASPDTIVFYKHYPTLASRDEHVARNQQLSVYRDLLLRINALLAAPVEIVEEMTPVVRYTRKPAREE